MLCIPREDHLTPTGKDGRIRDCFLEEVTINLNLKNEELAKQKEQYEWGGREEEYPRQWGQQDERQGDEN